MKPKPLTPAERNKKIANLLRKLARMAEKGENIDVTVSEEYTVYEHPFLSYGPTQVTVTIHYVEKERKNHE